MQFERRTEASTCFGGCASSDPTRVAGKWAYLNPEVDSGGATIDFLLSAKRDTVAAKRFFQKALTSPGHPGRGLSTWMRIRRIPR